MPRGAAASLNSGWRTVGRESLAGRYHQIKTRKERKLAEFTLKIDGMHCGSCVRRVSQALAATPGVGGERGSRGSGQAEFRRGAAAARSGHRRDCQGRLHGVSGIKHSRRGSVISLVLKTPPKNRPDRINLWPHTTTESLTLPVLGMTCACCQHHVEEALRATAGVERRACGSDGASRQRGV